MTDWDDYRYFLAVARATSVRKAANTLGVSHSTVLRRVTTLEEALGVRLFERMPNGYFTTEAGDDMMHSALRIEEETTGATRRIAGRDTQLSGKISVTMPSVFATHLLMPDLAAFRQAHPGIELEIIPTYTFADLAKREADVAIRVSNDPPEDLFGRRLLSFAKGSYVCADFLPGKRLPDKGSPHYSLHQKQSPTTKSQHTLLPLSWIGWKDMPLSPQWIKDSDYPNLPVGAIINDPIATLEAVKAGVGMAILPCFMADAEPDVYRMPPGTLTRISLWILSHEDLRNTARIRKFISFMAEAILKHRDLLEGKNPRPLPD